MPEAFGGVERCLRLLRAAAATAAAATAATAAAAAPATAAAAATPAAAAAPSAAEPAAEDVVLVAGLVEVGSGPQCALHAGQRLGPGG